MKGLLCPKSNCCQSGRLKKVSESTRRSGRPKVDKRLSSFINNVTQNAREELDKIVGVCRDSSNQVFYKVVWMGDEEEKWIRAEEMMTALLTYLLHFIITAAQSIVTAAQLPAMRNAMSVICIRLLRSTRR